MVALGKGQALNYFHLGVLYAKANQADPAIAAFARAIELEPDKYRSLLKEELKKVHSVLDPIRYKENFTRLLNDPINDSKFQIPDSRFEMSGFRSESDIWNRVPNWLRVFTPESGIWNLESFLRTPLVPVRTRHRGSGDFPAAGISSVYGPTTTTPAVRG